MSNPVPVLVVGAGPAGLVSALWLAQNGIKVRIIDKAEAFHNGDRGSGVQPRTFELFQTLGIDDDVQMSATPIPTMRAYKLPGGTEPIRTWDMYEKKPAWPDRPYPNGGFLSQATLEKILRTHLAKYDVTVELSKGLVAISQNADYVNATVAIHKSGQPTEEQETIIAEYLIGCDGAKGSTRKLLGLTFQGETRDADGMVWGEVEIQGLTSDYWHIWGTPGHVTIMLRPLSPTGKEFVVGIIGENFDPTELAKSDKVKPFIREETGRSDLQFGEFTWLAYFKPNMRMVNKFQHGRAFVAGGEHLVMEGDSSPSFSWWAFSLQDSAHVHPPTGGQGMNCSVQDASNLAWKLSLVLKGLSPTTLLSSFNDERLPVISHMLHETTALYTHTVSKETTVDEPTKDKPDDDKSPGWIRWRNTALELFGINYRYSDIVLEERDTKRQSAEDMLARAYSGYEGLGTLHAGDRAPEAPGLVSGTGVETSFFKLFKPFRHTVLVFAAEGDDNVLQIANKYPKHAVRTYLISRKESTNVGQETRLFDRDGHAHNAYLVDKDTTNVFVVRPDAFLGAIVTTVEGVDRYFAKIFKA